MPPCAGISSPLWPQVLWCNAEWPRGCSPCHLPGAARGGLAWPVLQDTPPPPPLAQATG